MSIAEILWRHAHPDYPDGVAPVAAANKIYHAERMQARKDWARTHAEMEPGRGLDGRPLQVRKKGVDNGQS